MSTLKSLRRRLMHFMHSQSSRNHNNNRSNTVATDNLQAKTPAVADQSTYLQLQRLIGNQAVGRLIRSQQNRTQSIGSSRSVIQRKLSPEALELAKQWERDVLNEATLDHSTERRNAIEQMNIINTNEDVPPRRSDTQFLSFLSAYKLPEADEDAIFDDAVPGVKAVEKITAKHRELISRLQNQLIDGYVEQNLSRAQRELRERGSSAEAISSVRSGTFTSVKDRNGGWDSSLNEENRQGVLDRAKEFQEFTGMAPPEGLPNELWITLYRRVKGSHLQSLKKGDTITEMLPFSTAFDRGFAEKWSPTEGVIFEIQVPVNYPALFQARRPGAEKPLDGPEPLNQKQSEVTLLQSELIMLENPRVEPDSQNRNNFIVKVSAKPISLDTAKKQHQVSSRMSDENRREVAAQQREDDPEEPSEFQEKLAVAMAPYQAALEEVYPKVRSANVEQITKIKERLLAVSSKGIFQGPAGDVLASVAALGAGDGVVLQTIIQRFFNPQFHTLPPKILQRMEQLPPLLNIIVTDIKKNLA
jgi:hypothetical protein